MSENKAFLEVKNLSVEYVTKTDHVYAVNDVSFTLEAGKTLGLVGETGAGKTTIARSILRVLPVPPAKIANGEIFLEGKNILDLSEKEMCEFRGDKITMIFQDPMTSLNPVKKVGDQIAEVVKLHSSVSKAEARKRAEEMLEMVGIPAERYDEYPHQFSGGMKQRIVIAIALACNPDLLLADEPTTALDVTIQAQVLDLMKKLNKSKNTAMILITHDLGVVAEMCDEVAVIYGGEIVESGTLQDIFKHPTHPYTKGLFGALPDLEKETDRLQPINGMPPDPTDLPQGCFFSPRCAHACEECYSKHPTLERLSDSHNCRCHIIKEES